MEHVRVYREAITGELRTALKQLETLSGDFSTLVDRFEAEWARIDNIGRVESKAIHQKVGNPNEVTTRDSEGECALRNEDGQELKNDPNS